MVQNTVLVVGLDENLDGNVLAPEYLTLLPILGAMQFKVLTTVATAQAIGYPNSTTGVTYPTDLFVLACA